MLHNKHTRTQPLTLPTFLLVGLLIPGSMFLLTPEARKAFVLPVLGVFWVGVISWGRWVLTPSGFMLMLVGLAVLHLSSYVWVLGHRRNFIQPPTRQCWSELALLCLFNAILLVSCHVYKDRWFGFALYHVPSESMSPTLQAGDIVLVDTWGYDHEPPKPNDIVLIQRTANSMVLVKRVTRTRYNAGSLELFIEGDNASRSVDSHRFGWLPDTFLIGKVTFVWLSFGEEGRYLHALR